MRSARAAAAALLLTSVVAIPVVAKAEVLEDIGTVLDAPVLIPENQGVSPEATVTYGGGSCTWVSDFLANSEGVELFADEFEVIVTPSGRVFAWSSYAAEPAECAPAVIPSAPAESEASPEV